jgi:hypothetical protein
LVVILLDDDDDDDATAMHVSSLLLYVEFTAILVSRFCVWAHNNNKINSVALVRERCMTTERPALMGEVSANHDELV